jgi:hypothetical protein
MDFWKRFPDEVNLRVVNEIKVSTIDLDSFCRENALDRVDFIKLDVEGAELDALQGAEELLKNSVVGLSIEIGFCRWRLGMPLLSEIDTFLRGFGFELFDISAFRHARNAFPEPLGPGGVPAYTMRGQVIWGEALYLRDAHSEITRQMGRDASLVWDETRILKLCTLFEIYGLHDCAIELLQLSESVGILKKSESRFFSDLLVRDVKKDFPTITYETYMHSLNRPVEKSSKTTSSRSWNLVRVLRKIVRILPRPVKRKAKTFLQSFRG